MRYFSLNELRSKINASFEWNNSMAFLPSSFPEADAFVSHSNKHNNLLFIGWIAQTKGLEELIIKGKSSVFFKDELMLQEHLLFTKFQEFLSPFLTPVLLKLSDHKLDYNAFSYLPLIQKQERAVLEDRIYSLIKPQFDRIKTQLFNGEKELIEPVQNYLKEENRVLVNGFSRASYALKVNYVENTLSVIHSKACTHRLAYWIVKQLETMTLNEEHIQKINEVKSDLKSGKISVKNVGKRKVNSFMSRSVLGGIVSVLLIGFVGWIIIKKPWSERDLAMETNNSSYKSFSVNERKQIDSLLRIIQPNKTFTPENYDLGAYLGEELELILRTPLKNKRAEMYYKDLAVYAKNYSSLQLDSCTAQKGEQEKQFLPQNMRQLDSKTDGKVAFFKNESSYDVQVVVFKNLPNSEVYYGFVKAGKKTEFNIQTGDVFFVVPGRKLNEFKIPPGYYGEETSEEFKEMFCEIDVNFMHGINTAHQLMSNSKASYKFLIVGSDSEQFELIDLYSVLINF